MNLTDAVVLAVLGASIILGHGLTWSSYGRMKEFRSYPGDKRARPIIVSFYSGIVATLFGLLGVVLWFLSKV